VTARPIVWRLPVALGALTASGLLSALVSDGIGDVWSWIALAVPLAVAAFCMQPCAQRNTSDGA
jgi:hypothetical protein